jgi:arylsulfatase A-like enzyme
VRVQERKNRLGSGVLPDQAITLAESLREAGFRTAAFNANPWISDQYGFEQGFEIYRDYSKMKRNLQTKRLLKAAASWMHSLGSDEPFFAYLHFMDVHAPYVASQRDYQAMLDSPSLGENRKLEHDETKIMPRHMRNTPWVSEQERFELKPWRAKYAACVRSFDRRITDFLEDLRNSLLLDNTYLIFTSDHGEELLEHGNWVHGFKLKEHQLHVPLLIRKPMAKDAGRRVDNLTSLLDLMPTILSLAHIDPPTRLQGRDISELLDRDLPQTETTVLSTATLNSPDLHSIRTRQHKLIVDISTDEKYLYDLTSDPGEFQSLVSSEEVLTEQLHRQLLLALSEIETQGPLNPEFSPISDELRERLKALGYVQ